LNHPTTDAETIWREQEHDARPGTLDDLLDEKDAEIALLREELRTLAAMGAALARARRLLDHGIEESACWGEQDAVCALLDALLAGGMAPDG